MRIVELSPYEMLMAHHASENGVDTAHPIFSGLFGGGDSAEPNDTGDAEGPGEHDSDDPGPVRGRDRRRPEDGSPDHTYGDGMMRVEGRRMAQHGRHGDTMLAHINPQEARMLRARGGSGTINPDTGLMEFYDADAKDRGMDPGGMGGNSGGSNTGGGQSDKGGHDPGSADKGVTNDNGGAQKNTGSGKASGNQASGSGSDTQKSNNNNNKNNNTASTPASTTKAPPKVGNATVADAMQAAAMGLTQTAYDRVATNLRDQESDYLNSGNSDWDNFGNWVASQLGFNEVDPTTKSYASLAQPGATRTDWSFDPSGAIGAAIGMATGVPLLGAAADTVSYLLGRPLAITLGPDALAPTFGVGTDDDAALGITDRVKLAQADKLTERSMLDHLFGDRGGHVTEADAAATGYDGGGSDDSRSSFNGTGSNTQGQGGGRNDSNGRQGGNSGADNYENNQRNKPPNNSPPPQTSSGGTTPTTSGGGGTTTSGSGGTSGSGTSIQNLISQLVFPYFPQPAHATINAADHQQMLLDALADWENT